MPRSPRTTLRLDVDLTCEPIEGEIQAPSGPAVPFVGWLGLAAALERAAPAPGHSPTTPQEEPHVP